MTVKLAATSEPEITLKDQIAAAKTEQDHRAVVGRIGRLIAAAEVSLKAIDDAREDAAIEGTTDENNLARTHAKETILSLKIAHTKAEGRRMEALGREAEEAMHAGIKAAHAIEPEVKALWIEYGGTLRANLSVEDKLVAKIAEMNGLQAHAIRRNNDDGSTRHLIASAAQMRADAAKEVPRPETGPSAPGPFSLDDNIALLSRIAVERILLLGVHAGDAHRARRGPVLSAVLPAIGPNGAPIVELATGTKGRPVGGFS